jgi:transposase
MIEVCFTKEELEQLQDLALNHPHPFVRRKALALHLKGYKIPHHTIAQITGVCENTFRTYCKNYSSDGIQSITAIHFRKPEGALVPFRQVVTDYIKETPPASVKQAIAEISALTGVDLKETQMRNYLKAIGVRFRKVGSVPAKADVAKQAQFKKNELEPRLAEAQMGKRSVMFVDSAHFVLGAFLGFLWSLTRVFIKTPSGRQRFNVLGALDAITQKMLIISNDTYITATEVCDLLRLIANSAKLPVTLVLDNARYQRCKLVIALAKELNIELLFLPPYSPNLNLIERLWKFTKKNCLNSKYYASFALFRSAINEFLENMQQTHAMELKSLLTLNFQIFTEDQIQRAA